MNVNRLRHYDTSIKDWNDSRRNEEEKDESFKNSDTETLQKTDRKNCNDPETACTHKNAHASHAPRMAEFDAANEITVLNPEAFEGHRPILDPHGIKPEPQDLEGSLDLDTSQDEEQPNFEAEEFLPPSAPPAPPPPSSPKPGPSGRKLPTPRDIVQNIFSPKRKTRSKTGGTELPESFAEQEDRLKIALGKKKGATSKATFKTKRKK